jgi:hypothetical protein
MVGRWQIAYLLSMAHFVLPVMGSLPAQLWLTLYCQWWVAYLLSSYGSLCIASGGLLTSSAAMAHIVLPVMSCLHAQLWLTLYCQWWVAYLLSDGSQVGHVFLVLPLVGCKPAHCSAMVRKWAMFVLTLVVFLPDKLWFSQVDMFVLPVVGSLPIS